MYALGTFSKPGRGSWPGIIRSGQVLPLQTLLPSCPAELGQVMAAWPEWDGRIDAAMQQAPQDGWLQEDALSVHLPYKPENLLGAGANYRAHVIELIVDKGAGGVVHMTHEERYAYAVELMDRRAATGKPFMFVALRGAIAGPHDDLLVPADMQEPDWELELAAVIGRPARHVARADALKYIGGYTIANDLTARELVARPDIPQMGMDFVASKSAPGFKVLGPYITPSRFVADPKRLHIRLSLNGQVMQDAGTDDMIFDVARLVEFASSFAQLMPGDVIMTGSPSGNGTHYDRFLRGGDVMVGEVDGLLGRQVTRCISAAAG